MHVRDMESLEIVVDVEGPVRVDEIVAGPRGVVDELAEREVPDPRAKRGHELGKWVSGSEGDEEEALPRAKGHLRQVVLRRREIRGPFELGHRMKAAVERETPTVITTAELLREAGSVRDERPAVRADVRKAVDLVLPVAREQERLVESAREQRERVYLSRDLDQVVVSRVLPGTREDALALEPKELRIGVHARRQRLGDADVRVDLEGVSAHGAAASYALPTP